MELQLSLFNDEILGVPNQDTFINSELEQLQLSPTWEKLATKPPAQTSTQELTLSLYPETNKIRPERVGSQKRGFDREKDLSTSNDVVPSASLLATPTTAFAVGGNVLQVTTTADENDGGLGGSGLSLRDAVLYALANPNEDFRIQLQAGETYTLTLDGRNEYKSLTGDLNVKGINLIIETIGGKDQATIDGNGLDRIFQVKDASLTLDNIKVTRGKNDSSYPAGQGGGISSSHSTLNLINSTITKNAGRLGGGIYSINSEIYLDNSEITDNTSKYDKGAGIYAKETGSNQAIVKLENSFIARNTADVGGVITAIGGVAIEVLNSTFEDNFGSSLYTVGEASDRAILEIRNSEFKQNKDVNRSLGGGGIFGEKANITVDDSYFLGNEVVNKGGAIYATDFSDLIVNNSTFIKNIAGESGGAIAGGYQTDVTITNSEFEGNSAKNGGAVSTIGNLFIDNVTFNENHATVFGGALSSSLGYGNPSGTILHESTVRNSRFENNTSDGDGGAGRLLGSKNNISHWQNVEFIGNEAFGTNGNGLTEGNGGALKISGGKYYFDKIVGNHNIAKEDAGFIYVGYLSSDTKVEIRNAEIAYNYAEDDGGGIHLQADTLNSNQLYLENVNAHHNQADIGGFLRAIDGIDIEIKKSIFEENYADFEGGVFSFEGSSANIIESKLNENSSKFGGGAIRVGEGRFLPVSSAPGQLTFVNSVANYNKSEQSNGGAILADIGSVVDIISSYFSGNQSPLEGAAIYGQSSKLFSPQAFVTVLNSTFFQNITDSNNNGTGASAVYMEPGGEFARFPSYAAELTSFNNIFANTINGNGKLTTDYDGAIPVAAANNLVRLTPTLGWDGTNIVGVDPNLVEIGDDLYAPSVNSIVIGKGDTAWLPLDTFDLDGDRDTTEPLPVDLLGSDRVIGGSLDLGAIEFDPNANNDPLLNLIDSSLDSSKLPQTTTIV